MAAYNLIAPAGWVAQIRQTPSQTVYTPDANGFVYVSDLHDIPFLLALGFRIFALGGNMVGRLIGANMNSTADQPLTMLLPASAIFRVTRITITNASISLTTAAGGFYPAASKGGTPTVANSQVYTALSAAAKALDATLADQSKLAAATQLYLSLTTAQGAAATADIYAFGDVLSQ
ncbi:MAG: hypothetical protein WDN04_13680 [Rhodospirillales bacterium]